MSVLVVEYLPWALPAPTSVADGPTKDAHRPHLTRTMFRLLTVNMEDVPMADDLIKRADEALKGVTPGPWYASQPDHAHGWFVVSTDIDGWDCIDESSDGGFEESTARFITAARELVPAMRDRIESDAERIAELEAALHRIAAPCAVSATADWRVMYEAWRALCVERVDIARTAIGEKKDG